MRAVLMDEGSCEQIGIADHACRHTQAGRIYDGDPSSNERMQAENCVSVRSVSVRRRERYNGTQTMGQIWYPNYNTNGHVYCRMEHWLMRSL